MYKVRNKKQTLCLLSGAAFFIMATPGLASNLWAQNIESHKFSAIILGIGALLIAGAFRVSSRRGGKSKQVEAYEAELEKFRQSIRR